MEDFDQRRPDEEEEFNQTLDSDGQGERDNERTGPPHSKVTSVTGERPSILGDRDPTEVEVPQRPSILGDTELPRTGPLERPSVTGREKMPDPRRKRAALRAEQSSQPAPQRQPTSQQRPPAQQQAPQRATERAAPKTARAAPATQKKRAPRKSTTRRTASQPQWLKQLRKEMPPFADEILAVLMIAVGLVSLLSLLGLASGDLADAWALFLSRTMGVGAVIVPIAIFVAGALFLLPRLGVHVPINWLRIVAGELFFVTLLGYIHLVHKDPDPWALALAGKGGGWIGWAIASLLRDTLGAPVGGFFLLVALVGTGGWAFGVGRHQLIATLGRIQNGALATVQRIERRQEERRRKRIKRTAPPQPVLATATAAESSDILPAYPGRPSIITGETGAGATIPANFRRGPSITRTRVAANREEPTPEAPAAQVAEEAPPEAEEEKKVRKERRHHFTVDDLPDKKKLGRRSTVLPPLELLDATDFERPDPNEVNANAEIIEDTLDDFGLNVEVVGVRAGPTVTQYAVQPFTEVEVNGEKMVERVRVTKIASLDQDLALALSTARVRIEAPVPGERYVGIEVPNDRPGIVSLRPVIESEEFYKVYNKSPLALALGRDVAGTPVAADLAQMPHLLIAGTTGSGKSVSISSMITCLTTNNSPYSLRLIMVDPKMVELIRFNGLPHLLGRVEVEMERIIGVLRWTTREMDRRYKVLEQAQARNLQIYNQRLGPRRRKQYLPNIVVFIDELADLMSFMADETERVLVRLAQMARAVGIHLVVATQRPSTDVVTGLIKANFPARLSFAVASSTDSRVILDATGAQQLIGRGDMLFFPPEAAAPQRIQGCFVSDAEMERIVDYWVSRQEAGKTVEELDEAPWERSLTKAAILEETDDLLEEAIALVQREGTASASLLQRKLNVGFPRAARLMDALHDLGLIGEEQAGGRTREVLIDPNADAFKRLHEERKND